MFFAGHVKVKNDGYKQARGGTQMNHIESWRSRVCQNGVKLNRTKIKKRGRKQLWNFNRMQNLQFFDESSGERTAEQRVCRQSSFLSRRVEIDNAKRRFFFGLGKEHRGTAVFWFPGEIFLWVTCEGFRSFLRTAREESKRDQRGELRAREKNAEEQQTCEVTDVTYTRRTYRKARTRPNWLVNFQIWV